MAPGGVALFASGYLPAGVYIASDSVVDTIAAAAFVYRLYDDYG